MPLSPEQARAKIKAQLSPLGCVLRGLLVVRVHDDGDGLGTVFRWWHPASWLVWIVLLPVCGVIGEPISDVVPFRVSKWFRENPERLQWL